LFSKSAVTTVSDVSSGSIANIAIDYDHAVFQPSSPTGLNAEAFDTSVSLSWNGVDGADYYNIHRSTYDGGYTYIDTTQGAGSNTSYTDLDLAAGTYYYKVLAVDSSGNKSPLSEDSAYATVSNEPPPSGDKDTLTLANAPSFYSVFVTNVTLTGSSSYIDLIGSDYVAGGSSAGESTAKLSWSSGDGNGTYNVLIDTGTEAKYQNSISFSNGSASLDWNTMSAVSNGPGVDQGAGSITFNGGLPSGAWSIYVVPGPITTMTGYLAAMTNYVALGASTLTSGGAVTLITSGAPGTFDPNGTYSIIYSGFTDPSDYSTVVSKYLNNVSFSGGNAAISVSAMSDQADLPYN
jgi:hypothetical protein